MSKKAKTAPANSDSKAASTPADSRSVLSANAAYIIKIALPLVIICALIALLVATVNHFTEPVIAKNNEKALREAIEELFPLPSIVYDECNLTLGDDGAAIGTVYAVTSDGSPVGYCVKLSPNGFKGKVDMIVSLDNSAFVTGVKITSTNDETAGIGTKVAEKSFTDQFIESTDSTLSTDVKDYVISGATKTSKPVTEAVFAAKRTVQYMINAGAATNDSADSGDRSELSEFSDLSGINHTEKEATEDE